MCGLGSKRNFQTRFRDATVRSSQHLAGAWLRRRRRIAQWAGVPPKNSIRQLYQPTGHTSNWVKPEQMARIKRGIMHEQAVLLSPADLLRRGGHRLTSRGTRVPVVETAELWGRNDVTFASCFDGAWHRRECDRLPDLIQLTRHRGRTPSDA